MHTDRQPITKRNELTFVETGENLWRSKPFKRKESQSKTDRRSVAISGSIDCNQLKTMNEWGIEMKISLRVGALFAMALFFDIKIIYIKILHYTNGINILY